MDAVPLSAGKASENNSKSIFPESFHPLTRREERSIRCVTLTPCPRAPPKSSVTSCPRASCRSRTYTQSWMPKHSRFLPFLAAFLSSADAAGPCALPVSLLWHSSVMFFLSPPTPPLPPPPFLILGKAGAVTHFLNWVESRREKCQESEETCLLLTCGCKHPRDLMKNMKTRHVKQH